MAYGIEVKRTNDPNVERAERAIGHLSDAAMPGTFLVDSLPFLEYIPEWFPGGGWKTRVREHKQEMNGFLNKPFDVALEGIVRHSPRLTGFSDFVRQENGSLADCFISRYIQDLPMGKLTPEERKVVKEMAGQIFIGGPERLEIPYPAPDKLFLLSGRRHNCRFYRYIFPRYGNSSGGAQEGTTGGGFCTEGTVTWPG